MRRWNGCAPADPGAREAAADPVLRAGVLRAAQDDRRDGDLPLLRFLLEYENAERSEWFAERWLAAVLVALHGRDEDVPLLRSATSGQVTDAAGAVEWARAQESERHARNVAAESEFTWIELARRQGRTENARVALIRLLDDTGPHPDRLRELSRALERLGDHAQAARAQFNLLSSRTPQRTGPGRRTSSPAWNASRATSRRQGARWNAHVRQSAPRAPRPMRRSPNGTAAASAV